MTNDSDTERTELAPPKMTPLQHGTHRGLRWAVVAAPSLGVNGYVQMPSGHPWQHLNYDDMPVEIHGGLTFASGRWIGFDTAHGGDVWPAEYDRHGLSDLYNDRPEWSRRWTLDAVIAETHRLADAVLAGEQS